MTTPPPVEALSEQNPWPGLVPFDEGSEAFFFGRELDRDGLARMVRRETVTVLFGQSGLGKTSLLRAGLFPLLRKEQFLPVYLRLDFSETSPSLTAQVLESLRAEGSRQRIEFTGEAGDATLWAHFHRRSREAWDARNRLVVPVLVFDQFEEVFTLGHTSPARRERCLALLRELADLTEHRVPAELAAAMEADPSLVEPFNFTKSDFKVVLAFREDYLPDFEGLRTEMRGILHNRVRLLPMTGPQAAAALLKAGRRVLTGPAAEAIVAFVSGARGGEVEPEAQRVEPALLSMICRELNQLRLQRGAAVIDPDLLVGARDRIIEDYYERSLADLAPAYRNLLEDHLITEGGFRSSYALEDALLKPGVDRAGLEQLVGRRMLRLEEQFGVPRLELIHDVLTPVVRRSRDLRRERLNQEEKDRLIQEQRRKIRVLWAVGLVMAALMVVAAFSSVASRQARARAEEAQKDARRERDAARAAELVTVKALLQAQDERSRLLRSLGATRGPEPWVQVQPVTAFKAGAAAYAKVLEGNPPHPHATDLARLALAVLGSNALRAPAGGPFHEFPNHLRIEAAFLSKATLERLDAAVASPVNSGTGPQKGNDGPSGPARAARLLLVHGGRMSIPERQFWLDWLPAMSAEQIKSLIAVLEAKP